MGESNKNASIMTKDTLFEMIEPEMTKTQAFTNPHQARVRRPVRNQVEWTARDLDSWLPDDHPARPIWAFLEQLDLSAFYASIKSVEGHPGHPTTDPRVLLALWLYATSQGIGSARQIDRLCQEHDAYRWLCGGVPVNYHTLSDFRVVNFHLLMYQRFSATMRHLFSATMYHLFSATMYHLFSAECTSHRREAPLLSRPEPLCR